MEYKSTAMHAWNVVTNTCAWKYNSIWQIYDWIIYAQILHILRHEQCYKAFNIDNSINLV